MFVFIRCLLLLLPAAFPGAALSAQVYSGHLSGTFSAAATDGSGNYAGAVEGNWNASGTINAGGAVIENLGGSGTFGGVGIAGNWNVTAYNPQTRTIAIAWQGPDSRGPGGNGGVDGTSTLVIDTTTGVATGGFQGQIFTPQGTKTVTGTWTMRLQAAANTVVTGGVQGSFNGSASFVGAVNGMATGTWTLRILPDGSVAGTANGSYDGGKVSVPGYGQMCICGTWLANITRGTNGQFRFEGSWTHPLASGTLDGRGGGPVVWNIDIGTVPIQASGSFDGMVGLTVPLPIIGTGSYPVNVTGNWVAVLPINP